MNLEHRKTATVLYTGAFRFPDGDAAAFRVHSVAKLIETTGATVSFAGWESAATHGAAYTFDGHECYAQGEFREGPTTALARLFGFFFRGRRTLKWLAERHYDVVIAYNPPAFFSLALILLGKLRGFKVVLDTTEWYEGSHLPGGSCGPAALENWMRMRLCYRLYRNVISISHFLARTYAGRNLIRLPPLREPTDTVPPRSEPNTGFKIIYAGDAGKKDKLLPFIRAIPALARALSAPVELHIAGLAQAALDTRLADAGLSDECIGAITCHGRLRRDQVFALYRECHFSILFREEKRYAWAGFPTKAMESWSSGCPIITNAVGDLCEIAEHMKNAVVISDATLGRDLPAALIAIAEQRLYDGMAAESLSTARRHFAPAAYRAGIAAFFSRL